MRKFKTVFNGEVDLDDPKTYEYLPDNAKLLDDRMFKNIGQAVCYMNHFHPDWFNEDRKNGQRKRVEEKIKYFCDNRRHHYNDIMWLKEQCFLFEEETENMC